MLVLGYFQKGEGFQEASIRWGGEEAFSNDPVQLRGEFLIG